MSTGRRKRGVLGTGLVLCLMVASGAAAQGTVPCPVAEPGALVLYGDIEAPVTLSVAQLAALPQVSVQGTSHSGEVNTFTGPTVQAVLAHAALPSGADLRGAEMLRYVVAEALDGYRVLFALAELDSMYRATSPILALQRDGEPLAENARPFQIIVADEPRHARWVRQVACLRIARHQ